MSIIGLIFLAGAVGTLSNSAWGCLVFGAGLVGFKVLDSVRTGSKIMPRAPGELLMPSI